LKSFSEKSSLVDFAACKMCVALLSAEKLFSDLIISFFLSITFYVIHSNAIFSAEIKLEP